MEASVPIPEDTCGSDFDCEGENVCESGQCVSLTPPPPGGNSRLNSPTISLQKNDSTQVVTDDTPEVDSAAKYKTATSEIQVQGSRPSEKPDTQSAPHNTDVETVNVTALDDVGSAGIKTGLVFFWIGAGFATISGGLAGLEETRGVSYALLPDVILAFTIGTVINSAAMTKRHRAYRKAGFAPSNGPMVASWLMSSLALATTGVGNGLWISGAVSGNFPMLITGLCLSLSSFIFTGLSIGPADRHWHSALKESVTSSGKTEAAVRLYPIMSFVRATARSTDKGMVWGLAGQF